MKSGAESYPGQGGSAGTGQAAGQRIASVPRDGLQPRQLLAAKDLFDPLADPLAHRITAMTRGAAVECGAAGTALIARDVRGDLERAAALDEVAGVVALVGPQGICRLPGNAVSSIARALLRSA